MVQSQKWQRRAPETVCNSVERGLDGFRRVWRFLRRERVVVVWMMIGCWDVFVAVLERVTFFLVPSGVLPVGALFFLFWLSSYVSLALSILPSRLLSIPVHHLSSFSSFRSSFESPQSNRNREGQGCRSDLKITKNQKQVGVGIFM